MPYARESITRMSGYVPGEQPRDRTYVKLNTNENPYPPSPKVFEALRAFDPSRLRLYPEPVAQSVRDAAAGVFGCAPDNILCGNGSDDLLTIALRTFVDQGGTLAYNVPSYSLYPVLADLQGARHAVIPLDEAFDLPDDAAARAADAGASLFIVCRPNAPTGNAFALEKVHRVCAEFPGVVWIDEAYVDFARDNCADFIAAYPNVVVSRTVSKSYSLAGIRLGIAAAPEPLIAEMMKVKDSYNVNMLTQVVTAAALSDGDYMRRMAQRIVASREKLTADLRSLGFTVLPSQTNFVLAKPPVAAEKLFLDLRANGFLVRYFKQPRINEYVRITIGTEDEMAAFTAAVRDLL